MHLSINNDEALIPLTAYEYKPVASAPPNLLEIAQ